MQPSWYRTAVFYAVDVAMFHDADGDGWGDLRGVADRLEYIRGLGANCVWLLPFYPSPYRDAGYDIVDHLSVDSRFGDLADFAFLLEKAEDLGLRVLVDLVAQHTSIDHPWFQSARRDLGHPVGATGTALVAKTVHELSRAEGELGLVTICCGGGLATGSVLRRLA